MGVDRSDEIAVRSKAVTIDSVDLSKFLQKLRIAKLQACNFAELQR